MDRADYTRGANCVRKSMGYYVRPRFVMISPDPSRRLSEIQLVHFEETWPLVLVPIAAGAVGVVMVLFVVAWSGGSRKWARTSHIVCPWTSNKPEQTGQLQFPCILHGHSLGGFWNVYPNDQGDQQGFEWIHWLASHLPSPHGQIWKCRMARFGSFGTSCFNIGSELILRSYSWRVPSCMGSRCVASRPNPKIHPM